MYNHRVLYSVYSGRWLAGPPWTSSSSLCQDYGSTQIIFLIQILSIFWGKSLFLIVGRKKNCTKFAAKNSILNKLKKKHLYFKN